MLVLFITASLVAILASAMVITRRNAIHALLYLVVSFLAVALIFYILGAPFAAALEVIIYAGAIIVLFVFAVMVLTPDVLAVGDAPKWTKPSAWLGPAVLTAILGLELLYVFLRSGGGVGVSAARISPGQVGTALYGPYVLGVEMVSLLLLSGLVGAYHLGREKGG